LQGSGGPLPLKVRSVSEDAFSGDAGAVGVGGRMEGMETE